MGSIVVLFLLVDACDRDPEMDSSGGGLGWFWVVEGDDKWGDAGKCLH